MSRSSTSDHGSGGSFHAPFGSKRSALTVLSRRSHRHLAVVGAEAGPGPVGADPQEPGLQGRSLLEALHPADHGDPGILRHVLRRLMAGDESLGEAHHARVVGVDQLDERGFVAVAQPIEKLRLRDHGRTLSVCFFAVAATNWSGL